MTFRTSTPLVPLLALALFACGCGEPSPPKTSSASSPREMIEGIKADAKSTLESAKEAFRSRQEDFRDRSKSSLAALERRIEELKEKARGAREEARPGLEKLTHDLEEQRERASEQLERWKDHGETAWESFTSGLERTLQDLDRKVGEALERAR
jgi:hypothetical protein